MSVNGIGSITTGVSNAGQTVKNHQSTDFAGLLSSCIHQSQSEINLDDVFNAASAKYGVPVNLLKAVAKAESGFRVNATSSCGAMGIMQLMPATAKSLGVSDAYDPTQNIMGGASYLSQLLREFGGDTELAVAAYNAGAGTVKKYGGIPPFQETQIYVAKVMGNCGDDLSAGSVPAVSAPAQDGLLAGAGEYDTDDLVQMALMSILQAQMSEGTESDNDSIGSF